jgi:hypothetical protein
MVFQGCELSVAHSDLLRCDTQMPSNVKANLLDDGVVDTLVSVGAKSGASPLRFHHCFGQRVNLLAWDIAILPFEKLVHRAPATLAFGSGHFPFIGGEQRTRESRERDERRATGERPGR